MIKITVINFYTRLNKGSTALLNSMINTINIFIPETEFTVFSVYQDYNQFPVKLVQSEIITLKKPLLILIMLVELLRCGVWSFINKYFHRNLYFLINNERLENYFSADIIINTGGDVLTEDYGYVNFFHYFSTILRAILLNKPVVIYAESIGPFNKYLNKIIANFILNRVKLITLREEKSKKYLDDIGVTKPSIFITADSAFLLDSASQQDIKNILIKEGIHKSDAPLIGLSVSEIISNYGFYNQKSEKRKYEEYIKLMAKIVDYSIENFNARIVFIPHVIIPWSDDRIVADDIISLLNYKKIVVPVRNEYTPEEMKGIIGQCDLFIGARMHACIASTSMFVPTIAIAYSNKTKSIIGEMLNCKRYVIDINDLTYDLLRLKINDAWENREQIKNSLKIKIPIIKKKAMLNGKMIKELLDDINPRID